MAWAPLAVPGHGLGQDAVGLLRRRAVGQQVERAAGEERRVELGRLQEVLQEQGLVLGRAELGQLGLVQGDVVAGGVGVAAGDGAGVDPAVGGAVLLVADAQAAAGVQLVEVRLLGGESGRVGLDRDGDQAQPQQARPARPVAGRGGRGKRRRRHGKSSWNQTIGKRKR
jgi:hypothetical protein